MYTNNAVRSSLPLLPATALFLIAVLPALSQAAFNFSPAGVRSASMGGAFVEGEEASLFVNPAAIAGLSRSGAAFAYSKPFLNLEGVDLGITTAALGIPTPWGGIGIGFSAFSASGLKEEKIIALGFARKLFGDRIRLGVTGKYLRHSYLVGSDSPVAHDPVFQNGFSKSAMGLDAGLSANLAGCFKLNAAVRNINQPDIGLSTRDRVPREIQAGLMLDMKNSGLTISGNVIRRMGESGFSRGTVPFLGLEKSLYAGLLNIRLGANPSSFTTGIGIKIGSVILDYRLALYRELMDDNAGSHQIGLTFKFGSISAADKKREAPLEKGRKTPKLEWIERRL